MDNSTNTLILLLFIAGIMIGAMKYRKQGLELRYYRELVSNPPVPVQAQPAIPVVETITAETYAGAGVALKTPPQLLQTTLNAIRQRGDMLYRFPLGWFVGASGAKLMTAKFTDDVNHVLITGQSNAGKDNIIKNIFFSLAKTHTAQQVQFIIIDGKGLDWQGWDKKEYTKLLITDPEAIPEAITTLTHERKERKAKLVKAQVSKWENYEGNDMPLLIVFISELLLLQDALGKTNLAAWLNTELTAARAFGIRYMIATQTASNFDTQWRSQISLFLAGYQPAQSQDMPNTGRTTNELEALNIVPPSQLPDPTSGAAGLITAVQGRNAINLRSSYISDQQQNQLLKDIKTLQQSRITLDEIYTDTDYLDSLLQPETTTEPLDVNSDMSRATIERQKGKKSDLVEPQTANSGLDNLSVNDGLEALPVAVNIVPADEQRAIIEAAETAKSRSQISKKLYRVTGGTGFNKVKIVCDALGILMPQPK